MKFRIYLLRRNQVIIYYWWCNHDLKLVYFIYVCTPMYRASSTNISIHLKLGSENQYIERYTQTIGEMFCLALCGCPRELYYSLANKKINNVKPVKKLEQFIIVFYFRMA
jgi:hypothetical protein